MKKKKKAYVQDSEKDWWMKYFGVCKLIDL